MQTRLLIPDISTSKLQCPWDCWSAVCNVWACLQRPWWRSAEIWILTLHCDVIDDVSIRQIFGISILLICSHEYLVTFSKNIRVMPDGNADNDINGLVQDSSISITNALEILQCYIKPLICSYLLPWDNTLRSVPLSVLYILNILYFVMSILPVWFILIFTEKS